MFFKKIKTGDSIVRVDLSSNNYALDSLSDQIKKLDQEILELNQIILEAQSVRFRSIFSTRKNFLDRFQNKILESSATNSVSWHQNRLREVYLERKKLQERLERLTGSYWPNKIKRLLTWMALLIVLIVFSVVFLMGLFAAFYFLPIIIFLVIIFWIISTLRRNLNL